MFTTGQIKEIAQRLEAMGKKDSQFPLVTSLNGGETVAVVQNGENKRINLGDIFRPFQDYIVPPIQTAIQNSENNIKLAVKEAKEEIQKDLYTDFTTLSSVIGEKSLDIMETLGKDIDNVVSLIKQIDLQEVIDNDNNNRNILQADINNLGISLKTFISNAETAVLQAVKTLPDDINSHSDANKEEIIERINTFENTLMTSLGTEFQYLQNIINRVSEEIQELLVNQIKSILDRIDTLETELKELENTNHQELLSKLTEYYNNLLLKLTNLQTAVIDRISQSETSVLDRIENAEQDLGNAITETESTVMNRLELLQETLLESQEEGERSILTQLEQIKDAEQQFREETVTLEVNCQVENAVININNNTKNRITLLKGSLANIRITAPGYHPFTQIVNVFRNTELNIVLDVINDTGYHIVEIRPVPEDSMVLMDNVEKTRDVYKTGSLVHIEVSHEHYETWTYDLEVTGDTVIEVPLVPMNYTLTVNTVPEGSTVVINGQTVDSLTAPYGTSYTVEVSHEGYVSKTVDVGVIDRDTEIEVNLDLRQITVNIETEPSDADVVMNSQAVKTLTVDYGTVINWVASLTGYLDRSGSYMAVEDKTIRVVLDRKYIIIPDGHLLYSHEGGTQTTAVQSNTEWIFK